MNEGIRRIFYDILTGDRIQEVGRGKGMIIPTIEQDIATYTALSERNRSTFDVLELPFGAFAQDFAECNGYRVNVVTKELEFSYPDPNTPEEPPVFQKPLTEQIAEANQKLSIQEQQITELNLQDIFQMELLIERGLV